MAISKAFVRQITTHVAAQRADAAAASHNVTTPEETLGLQFRPGDRVVDLVTGQEGIVNGAHEVPDLIQPARPHLDRSGGGEVA